jgi:multidrug transporter EmrE-like cation transporter
MAKALIALYILTTSSALIALKWGSSSGSPIQVVNSKLHLNLNPYVIVGIALYGTSFLLYTFLISKYDLGYIIPLTTAFVYVLIFFASFFIFKELFTVFKITGIFLILMGIVLLNLKK